MKKSKVSRENRLWVWQPLAIRDFLLLFIGESVSLLGDQFYLVALPWLTIQLTQSPLSLGGVLMAGAVPRAVLMLIGGVASDRFSPRFIMLLSNIVRALLTVLLTLLVALRVTQVWHLYLLAICFGVVDGFFIPAAKSIIPTLVTKELLAASNALSQGANQLIILIGPALGGLLIATFKIETAFAIDAVSFIFATVILLLIRQPQQYSSITRETIPIHQIATLMAGIHEGFSYTWHNSALKAVLLVVTVLNFIFIGPLEVGITSLAQNRFPGGVIALGTMKSAWGGGALVGTLMPGILHHLPPLGVLMLTLASIQACGLLLLSFIPNLIWASITIAVLGCCGGFFTIMAVTWIQRQTPPEILGRVMSLSMLSSFGVAPFSYALSGLLANLNLVVLFGAAGCIMLIVIALLAVNQNVRKIT